jgi:hypothetical protein
MEYLDNILIFSDDPDHLECLTWEVLSCLEQYNLYLKCYGWLAVVSDLDGGGVCPECRQRVERSAVLYRSKYNGAMLGSRWT